MAYYATQYAYGSHVINHGTRADTVLRFENCKQRDAWVARGAAQIGPGERAALTRKAAQRSASTYTTPEGELYDWTGEHQGSLDMDGMQ